VLSQVWLKMQRLKTNHKSAASQAAHIQRRLLLIWGLGASVMCFMAYAARTLSHSITRTRALISPRRIRTPTRALACTHTHTHTRTFARARARRWQLSQYFTLDYTEFPLVVPDVVLTRWLVYKVSP
jgi:hypothetical protein